ncbi:MAG: LuxR C-terminal-related transcriptional regulator [Chloroflexota bacterium]|nr:LuxR C-terminal-related transcriptional regulator [Chloroflexota bacterium]
MRHDFALDAANSDVVREICRRLDGLPLAIELAAARVTVMKPVEILARMSDRFSLLSGGQRDAPPRLRSMHGAIAWSYDLLSSGEQWLFRQLSVLNGSFSLSAAERIGGDTGMDIVTGLASLVDCSLVDVPGDAGTETRYVMLETVREFGQERLAASGEEASARDRMAKWCLDLARMESPDNLVTAHWRWLDQLEPEVGHLRSTLAWLEASGRMADVAELATRLRWFWFFQGREREGLQWLEKVLAWHEMEASQRSLDVLIQAGQFAVTLGGLSASGYLADAAISAREQGDAFAEAEAHFYLALSAECVGNYDEAAKRLLHARKLHESLQVTWRLATVTYHLGVLAYATGDWERAARLMEAAGPAAADVGNWATPLMSRAFLALVACQQGAPMEAARQFRDPLEGIGSVSYLQYSIIINTAAVVAGAFGQYELSARLLGAAARTGVQPTLPERSAFERAEWEARTCLGDETFERVWEDGRRIPREDIDRELARLRATEATDTDTVPAPAFVPGDLTPREREVMKHLANGLTNPPIADALSISRKTVTNHVASIQRKLNVNSRTAAAGFAIRHRLD